MENPKTQISFFIKATLLLGSTITVMAGSVIAPCLPELNAVFKDTPNANFLVKLVLTIPSLFIAFSAPFIGVLLDGWGRKPVLILSLVLYGISGTSGYFLDSIYAILVSRALLGVSVAGLTAGFITLISDYFTGPGLNKFMGLQSACMAFGGVFFMVVGGAMADIGWRIPFLLYLIAFFILPAVLFFIHEPESVKTTKTMRSKEPLPIKNLISIYTLTFLGMAIMFMIPVQLPFYLKTMGNISNTKIGAAIGVLLVFTGLVAPLRTMRRRRRRR